MVRKVFTYETPLVEIVEVRTEGCFASSLNGSKIKDWEDDGDDVDL